MMIKEQLLPGTSREGSCWENWATGRWTELLTRVGLQLLWAGLLMLRAVLLMSGEELP